MLGSGLELKVDFRKMVANNFSHPAVEIGKRQLKMRLRLRTGAYDARTRIARNLEHRNVFTQGVNEEHADADISCVDNSAFKQARTVTPPSAMFGH